MVESGWVDKKSGREFTEGIGFAGEADGVDRLSGFDTFWYNLANIVEGSVLLEGSAADQGRLIFK